MATVKTSADGGSSGAITRRQRAQVTRLRMIEAAHRLFVERGYTGAKMTDIAAAAGVAVQTVYFTFHTKSELLQACYEVAVLGTDDPQPPHLQPWWARLMAAGTGAAAVREFVEGNTSITRRAGALDDIVRSAAHEPDAVAVHTQSERLRRKGYRDIAEHLAERFGLGEDLDVDAATDLMLTLAGPATYRALVLEYKWPEERYAEWLCNTLCQQLLGPRRRRNRP